MTIQRLPYGNRIPGIQFTEESILPNVNGDRINVTCILGTAKSGPTDPTLVTSKDDFKKLFGDALVDNYGIKAANYILPNTVLFVRVLSKGARVSFVDNSNTLFIAKEGGINLQGASLAIEVVGEKITFTLSKDDEILELIECSNNELSSEYVHRVFNSYSTYLKLNVNGDFEFESKALVGTGGTTGAKCATATGEGIAVSTKYPDSRLNGVKIHLLQTLNGRPYLQLYQDSILLEEIPFSSDLESIDEFKDRVNGSSSYIEITELTNIATKTITLENGDGGTSSISDDDYIEALDKIADSSIYSIDTLIIPGVTSNLVQTRAIETCSHRGDTLFIADHPLGLRGGAVRDFIQAKGRFASNNALNSTYCACFSPWVKINDGNVSYYPSSIIASRLLADNDANFNVWDSCAGIKRGLLNNIAGIEYNASKTELDLLYNDALVNPIVNIPGKGFVIWGNKTTKVPVYANAPEPICSLNVRRLINYLRKIIYDATLPFVFEANDSFSWASLNNVICPKLDAIVNGRGLDAYKFVCDGTTNTPEAVDQLQLNATLSIRPTRCAEFINIALKVYPYTVEFDGGEE